jgi:hypothetical protein
VRAPASISAQHPEETRTGTCPGRKDRRNATMWPSRLIATTLFALIALTVAYAPALAGG